MLPTKLGKPPLADAIFEMRFRANFPASTVLPGLLLPKLKGATIQRLPVADLPEVMRHADQNLRYAPLIRMIWGRFLVLIGDYSFGLGCILPYPGWSEFKANILELLSVVSGSIEDIERYSLKYLDIVPHSIGKPSNVLNMNLEVGSHRVEDETFLIRVEIQKAGVLHIVQFTSAVTAVATNGTKFDGIGTEIDSIVMTPGGKFSTTKDFSERLELLHSENKTMFFSCLLPEAIEKMEPEYA